MGGKLLCHHGENTTREFYTCSADTYNFAEYCEEATEIKPYFIQKLLN
jgi:hypothetical protein